MFTFEQTKQIQAVMPTSPTMCVGDFYYNSAGELYVVGKIPSYIPLLFRKVVGDQWMFRGVDMIYVPNPIEVLCWLNKRVEGLYSIVQDEGNYVVVYHDTKLQEFRGKSFEEATFLALMNEDEYYGAFIRPSAKS